MNFCTDLKLNLKSYKYEIADKLYTLSYKNKYKIYTSACKTAIHDNEVFKFLKYPL